MAWSLHLGLQSLHRLLCGLGRKGPTHLQLRIVYILYHTLLTQYFYVLDVCTQSIDFNRSSGMDEVHRKCSLTFGTTKVLWFSASGPCQDAWLYLILLAPGQAFSNSKLPPYGRANSNRQISTGCTSKTWFQYRAVSSDWPSKSLRSFNVFFGN